MPRWFSCGACRVKKILLKTCNQIARPYVWVTARFLA
ncbi:hypothetical protein ALQ08_103899 [Pseudomonas syringae pv. delphinii]|uniref:Uncharacterized protein n=1 Tax=Pseudomonas syringae pv. delphinii TaxID=192088 RepID=A0A0P9PZZ8_9PSED|nr:hypothetical protein ALO72_103189 [Pseudomonas syringae pv. delphinii]RMP13892.1 hypothetical protein ALQ28_103703 [Pseudomonas syringae pv. delphinii]RMP23627.1 hypothetical protein ALQ27_103976 [Pseudomonas syringae pv. delphinii]RMQ19946.1 hypothetical protein ALQ08_103899 [Pseudomonas syringae pv. delphinii]